MSEQILLLNPRHKHKRRTNRRRARKGRMPAGLARYWASRRGTNPRRHKRRRHVSRRRRHARAANPRRVLHTGRHYRARARRPNRRRRHHARRRHSNPRFHLPSARGMVGAYIIPAVIGGVGGLVLDLAWGFLAPKLPPSVQTGYAGLAAKLAVVLGVAFGVNKFMPRLRVQTNRAAIGGATVLAYGAIKGIAQSVLPATTPGLAGYIDYQSYALPGAGRLNGYMSNMPRTLGSLEDLYSPAAVIQPAGTAVPRQFGGLRGYIAAQPHMTSGGGLMGYDWQNDGM